MTDQQSDIFSSQKPASLACGAEIIRNHVRLLPETAGVYRMLNSKGDVLYVGKAKSLKKRVANYTQVNRLTGRLQRMVSETATMEFIHTHTEIEALLLEANMIKRQRPKYNILLKDDKAFAQIFISGDHDFPLLRKHRGARDLKGNYYGPFASGADINATINILQRVFKIRNCTDSYFANRSRPCLQYHIKRCTAPCVGYVKKQEYQAQVKSAQAFLSGKTSDLQKEFAAKMEVASAAMEYEQAAEYRDRIKALTSLQRNQTINLSEIDDADIMAVACDKGKSCVQVFFFRSGQNFGSKAYFPQHDPEETPENILSSFIVQFYADRESPDNILLSHDIHEISLVEQALSAVNDRVGKKAKAKITVPKRGVLKKAVDFVQMNATDALNRHLIARASDALMLDSVAQLFEMDATPERIEIYDNSHISGTNMVGVMVVAGADGFIKNAYRKFNIRSAAMSDDYGMMREVMARRFRQTSADEDITSERLLPDLLLIDGGQGQLNAVMETLTELGIAQEMTVVAIAKGEDRNAGREKFFMPGKSVFQLPVNEPVLHYLQRLRDEAHRFAIGTHRNKRIKQIGENPLDEIAGIGPKRKKALLMHFGSAKAVSQAGVADLEKVEGISSEVAQKIYDHFHEAR